MLQVYGGGGSFSNDSALSRHGAEGRKLLEDRLNDDVLLIQLWYSLVFMIGGVIGESSSSGTQGPTLSLASEFSSDRFMKSCKTSNFSDPNRSFNNSLTISHIISLKSFTTNIFVFNIFIHL